MFKRGTCSFWFLIGLVSFVCCLASVIQAQETKYASGTSSAALTFGPQNGRQVIKSVYATTDKAGGVVKFYARGSAGKAAPTATPTNGATVIYISNPSYATSAGFYTNDVVTYVHANGTLDQTTVAACTASNVTLTAGITVAGATGDYLYELTQQGQILVGLAGTGAGTNDVLTTAGDVFAVPGDSPCYVVLDGTSSATLQATRGE